MLLRLLLMPLLIPFFKAVVALTTQALRGWEIGIREITMIVAFDLVYLAVGQLLFEHVVADFDG